LITGAHSIIYSKDAAADRAFLKELFDFPHVDVGGGWMIFGLPPAELAVHPGNKNDVHELYLMCDDVEALVASLAARGVKASPIQNLGWGMLISVKLPGGGKLGIYQPRHERPPAVVLKKVAAKKKPAAKKIAAKKKPAAKKGKARP
jgi:hypothetical protein